MCSQQAWTGLCMCCIASKEAAVSCMIVPPLHNMHMRVEMTKLYSCKITELHSGFC